MFLELLPPILEDEAETHWGDWYILVDDAEMPKLYLGMSKNRCLCFTADPNSGSQFYYDTELEALEACLAYYNFNYKFFPFLERWKELVVLTTFT